VFIKRVVAGPGDTIAVVGGHAIRNGRTEADPYIAPCSAGSDCSFPTALTLTSGEYYMLGDNRGVSDDSRFWGPVPAAWIIGTVVRCSMLGAVCHPVGG
jgi:signal peptidase I